LDILYATPDGPGRTRANGDHEFLRAELDATRIQDLTQDFSVKVAVHGQYSDDPLLASEEFTVGGARFGRAYDGGEIAGDHGAAGLIEFRYSDAPRNRFVDTYQLYLFYDFGSVWNIDPQVREQAQASLASIGGGVRFNLAGNASGYIEMDAPLTRPVGSRGSQGREPRIFASILQRF
jgi:hemolysin activation/secretion protein